MYVALALALAVSMQEPPAGQIVWQPQPDSPAPAPATAPPPPIPDWARTDPFGYERSECSPLVRKAEESLDACQARVRHALAANLGDALPPGLTPANTPSECRQAADGDRYAVQCGAAPRDGAPTTGLRERTCESRPEPLPQGGVVWTEVCRPAGETSGSGFGLKLPLGGD